MLIQTESLAVINTNIVSFEPYRNADGIKTYCDENSKIICYKVVTPSMRTLCSITPRECEIILHLESSQEAENKVLRTKEWGLINGSLNYRHAQVLTENITGSATNTQEMLQWLKSKLTAVEKSTEKNNDMNILNLLDTLELLKKDQEFYEMTAEGRNIIRDMSISDEKNKQKIRHILENWDKIFVELPF